jgi:hypothetical protein
MITNYPWALGRLGYGSIQVSRSYRAVRFGEAGWFVYYMSYRGGVREPFADKAGSGIYRLAGDEVEGLPSSGVLV